MHKVIETNSVNAQMLRNKIIIFCELSVCLAMGKFIQGKLKCKNKSYMYL